MRVTAIVILSVLAVLLPATWPVLNAPSASLGQVSLPTIDRAVSLENLCVPRGAPLTGAATQGGYRFDYRSYRGNNCRDYRLTNTPGQLSLKVEWRYPIDKLEPILCETKLPICSGSATSCPPFDCRKNTPALAEPRTTELGYGGSNADAFTDRPMAYVTDRDPADFPSEHPPIRTILQGAVGDISGKPVEIAVEVTSTVVNERPYRLTYSVRTNAKVGPLQMWLPEIKPTETDIVVRWQTVESDAFFTALRKQNAFPLRLSADRLSTNVEIATNNFQVASKSLIVLQGNEVLASTSAPAYLPSK
jgi:hypothetical protein